MQKDDNIAAGFAPDYLFECPSFSTYYCDRQVAASRAVGEVSRGAKQPQSELDGDEFGIAALRFEKRGCEDGDDLDDEDDFEFSALCDESFPESEIGRIFPIFDRDLVLGGSEKVEMRRAVEEASVSLGKMFIEEHEDRGQSGNGIGNVSSSEADELDGVEWTCCVGKRKTPELSPGRCRKIKSTGSWSRRWKLLDLLLRRSSCGGKESFVFLTPSPSTSSTCSSSSESKSVKSKAARRTCSQEYKAAGGASAHEIFYVKNRAVREKDRRRSYLPYRKGLVGFGFFLTVWA